MQVSHRCLTYSVRLRRIPGIRPRVFSLIDPFLLTRSAIAAAADEAARIGPLIAVFAAVAALIVYGLFAWERIVRRRREQDPGST